MWDGYCYLSRRSWQFGRKVGSLVYLRFLSCMRASTRGRSSGGLRAWLNSPEGPLCCVGQWQPGCHTVKSPNWGEGQLGSQRAWEEEQTLSPFHAWENRLRRTLLVQSPAAWIRSEIRIQSRFSLPCPLCPLCHPQCYRLSLVGSCCLPLTLPSQEECSVSFSLSHAVSWRW